MAAILNFFKKNYKLISIILTIIIVIITILGGLLAGIRYIISLYGSSSLS